MDRRSFFAAALGGFVGALVAPFAARAVRRNEVTIRSLAWGKLEGVTFYRDGQAYEAPRVTYVGRSDIIANEGRQVPSRIAAADFEATLQRLNTALPTFGDCPRFSVYDLPSGR
jgi:hypothetical protein